MTDIVKLLRSPYTQDQSRNVALEYRAADEIERLRAELAEMENNYLEALGVAERSGD